MIEVCEQQSQTNPLHSVAFAQIDVGEKFTTDRWMWEKIDHENAKALDRLMGRPSDMLGAVLHFQPWSKVQPVGYS